MAKTVFSPKQELLGFEFEQPTWSNKEVVLGTPNSFAAAEAIMPAATA